MSRSRTIDDSGQHEHRDVSVPQFRAVLRHPNGRPKVRPLRDVPPIDYVWTPPLRHITQRAALARVARRAEALRKLDLITLANLAAREHNVPPRLVRRRALGA